MRGLVGCADNFGRGVPSQVVVPSLRSDGVVRVEEDVEGLLEADGVAGELHDVWRAAGDVGDFEIEIRMVAPDLAGAGRGGGESNVGHDGHFPTIIVISRPMFNAANALLYHLGYLKA